MSCEEPTKFTITKGLENTFVFTIKANGSTLPMVIEPTDSFSAKLVLLDDDSVAISKGLTVDDAANGKVTLTVTLAESNSLIKDRGSKTDRYYLRPVYKLIIDCDTINNGKFIAKVSEIYVD